MVALKLSMALIASFSLPIACDSGSLSNTGAAGAQCARFGAQLSIPNVKVNFATYLTANTTIQLEQDYGLEACGWKTQIIPQNLCRIAMYVATSNRSGITLEAWLPDAWSGRFASTGNGGNSGCLRYPDMGYLTSFGFATVGANNGHNGTRGFAFLNNPDVIQDFAYRSVHTGVVLGKQITAQYYGRPHKKSYYVGCSTGGRQGWKMVQSFPKDFDGVLVGCPALNFPSLQSWSSHFYPIFGDAGSPTYVPAGPLWDLIHAEIMKQCDGIDGVFDGIIEDTRLCQFRPEALQCSKLSVPGLCLTGAQVGAVRQVYTDFYGVHGQMIYPRMQPGSEKMASEQFYSNGSFLYGTDWFRYVVYNNSAWDPKTFTINDAQVAIDQNSFDIATWNGDLSPFKKAGGKVLHYSGLVDATITSDKDIWYYDHVSRTMNLSSEELDSFYRLFRISGMGHCVGGDGAHNLGQRTSDTAAMDVKHNVVLAIIDWVEKGNAPQTITGTKFIDDNNKTAGIDYERRHCRYPYRNFCMDPVNYKNPDSWKCII